MILRYAQNNKSSVDSDNPATQIFKHPSSNSALISHTGHRLMFWLVV